MTQLSPISPADSVLFAELSGDFTPLHLDPTAARRLLFGTTVPHGVHVMLCGLQAVARERGALLVLRRLQAVFSAPPSHDVPLAVSSVERADGRLTLTIAQAGVQVQSITATLAERAGPDALPIPDAPFPPEPPTMLDLDGAAGLGDACDLRLDRGRLATLFPGLAELATPSQLAVLLALTRIVGMKCPGSRSVFADLTVTFEAPLASAPPTLQFRTRRADPRMSLVRIGVEGPGATGEVTALFRPAPTAQASATDLAGLVRAGEFTGQQALVIGGSRGLGEVTAKLLAAAGAVVAITYARGRADAQAVADDIAAAGGSCLTLPFDVQRPPAAIPPGQLPADFRPSHVYFFASPPIRLVNAPFNPDRFHHYCDYYVTGLTRSLAAVDRLFALSAAPLSLFYPSTIFLDERPAGAAEYAAAKAAGETTCRFLPQLRPGLRVVCERLPMLRTDQTNTLRGPTAGDPAPVLLEVLRRVRGGDAATGAPGAAGSYR
jgi:acyl dehydratase